MKWDSYSCYIENVLINKREVVQDGDQIEMCVGLNRWEYYIKTHFKLILSKNEAIMTIIYINIFHI